MRIKKDKKSDSKLGFSNYTVVVEASDIDGSDGEFRKFVDAHEDQLDLRSSDLAAFRRELVRKYVRRLRESS